MIKPISPVAYDPETRWGVSEIVFAKEQPQYIPLPALKFEDGLVVTRWKLSWRERVNLIFGDSIYLGLLTYNRPLQPIRMSTSVEEIVGLMPEDVE
jgi:hypothetical protein